MWGGARTPRLRPDGQGCAPPACCESGSGLHGRNPRAFTQVRPRGACRSPSTPRTHAAEPSTLRQAGGAHPYPPARWLHLGLRAHKPDAHLREEAGRGGMDRRESRMTSTVSLRWRCDRNSHDALVHKPLRLASRVFVSILKCFAALLTRSATAILSPAATVKRLMRHRPSPTQICHFLSPRSKLICIALADVVSLRRRTARGVDISLLLLQAAALQCVSQEFGSTALPAVAVDLHRALP